jgi:hypothetical protein
MAGPGLHVCSRGTETGAALGRRLRRGRSGRRIKLPAQGAEVPADARRRHPHEVQGRVDSLEDRMLDLGECRPVGVGCDHQAQVASHPARHDLVAGGFEPAGAADLQVQGNEEDG